MPELVHESTVNLPPGFQLIPPQPEVRIPPGFTLLPPQDDAARDLALLGAESVEGPDGALSKMTLPGSPQEAAQKRLKELYVDAPARKEEEQFAAARTPVKRLNDTLAFVQSLPIRMATHGKYGAGDVAGAFGFDKAKAEHLQSEQDFARANAGPLWYLGAAGEVAMGVPMFSTMGRAATAATHLGSRNPIKAHLAETRAANAVDDLAAHERLKVEPFGPAFHESPGASVGKQITETPPGGFGLRSRLEMSLRGTARAAQETAERYGTTATAEGAGRVMQEGLERFKEARPGTIVPYAGPGAYTQAQRSAIIAYSHGDAWQVWRGRRGWRARV